MGRAKRIGLYSIGALTAWGLAYFFSQLPVKETLAFREVSGPKYFHEAWVSSHVEGTFKMAYPGHRGANCLLESKRGHQDFLDLLVDSSGYGIMATDEEGILEEIRSMAESNPPPMVYFKYQGRRTDFQNVCDAAAARQEGAVMMFELGTPEDLIEYHEGLCVLFAIVGLLSIGALWR